MKHTSRTLALAFAAATVATPLVAQMEDVEIRTVPVADGVYMLMGRGGNIGLSIGEDGAFVIDDQYAPLTDKILAAIRELTDKPVRFVINTHWHGDHTGGNENMGKAGAIIVAHENVRVRMSEEQFIEAFDSRTPPAPVGALPVITFSDAVTFHWNGDDIRVFHVEHAHTDGDAMIRFSHANAVHMGDIYFNGMYPFIDVSTGGGIDGMIRAVAVILETVDDDTQILPGHGALSNRAELRDYWEMLITARLRMRELIAEGKSKEEIVAAKPTADLDAKWGGGFMEPDVWVGIVYDGMVAGR